MRSFRNEKRNESPKENTDHHMCQGKSEEMLRTHSVGLPRLRRTVSDVQIELPNVRRLSICYYLRGGGYHKQSDYFLYKAAKKGETIRRLTFEKQAI